MFQFSNTKVAFTVALFPDSIGIIHFHYRRSKISSFKATKRQFLNCLQAENHCSHSYSRNRCSHSHTRHRYSHSRCYRTAGPHGSWENLPLSNNVTPKRGVALLFSYAFIAAALNISTLSASLKIPLKASREPPYAYV